MKRTGKTKGKWKQGIESKSHTLKPEGNMVLLLQIFITTFFFFFSCLHTDTHAHSHSKIDSSALVGARGLKSKTRDRPCIHACMHKRKHINTHAPLSLWCANSSRAFYRISITSWHMYTFAPREIRQLSSLTGCPNAHPCAGSMCFSFTPLPQRLCFYICVLSGF